LPAARFIRRKETLSFVHVAGKRLRNMRQARVWNSLSSLPRRHDVSLTRFPANPVQWPLGVVSVLGGNQSLGACYVANSENRQTSIKGVQTMTARSLLKLSPSCWPSGARVPCARARHDIRAGSWNQCRAQYRHTKAIHWPLGCYEQRVEGIIGSCRSTWNRGQAGHGKRTFGPRASCATRVKMNSSGEGRRGLRFTARVQCQPKRTRHVTF
jgi:hypothetical protein